MATIGEKIKKRRLEIGMSQRELARQMGYTDNSTLARIEKGTVDVSQSKIVQFSKVLNCTIAYLMDWEETEKKNDQIVELVTRLRKDEDFLNVVQSINNLQPKQYEAIKQMLIAFNL